MKMWYKVIWKNEFVECHYVDWHKYTSIPCICGSWIAKIGFGRKYKKKKIEMIKCNGYKHNKDEK